MEEIKVVTPQVAYEPSKVIYDFKDLDESIVEIEKRYMRWLPSEEEIKDAEKVAKQINGVAKEINDEKVRIKKDMNKESKIFEDEVMARVNRLKVVRQNIVDALDVYEQKRKAEKKAEITMFFTENRGELGIPFEKVFKEEMLNKSCAKKSWQSDISVEINAIEQDYRMLDMMNVEDLPLLKSIYMQVWDRYVAIDKYNEQISARKKADLLRQEQAERETQELLSKPVITFSAGKEDPNVNEMVSIVGKESAYQKVREYALSLGLTWDEM